MVTLTMSSDPTVPKICFRATSESVCCMIMHADKIIRMFPIMLLTQSKLLYLLYAYRKSTIGQGYSIHSTTPHCMEFHQQYFQTCRPSHHRHYLKFNLSLLATGNERIRDLAKGHGQSHIIMELQELVPTLLTWRRFLQNARGAIHHMKPAHPQLRRYRPSVHLSFRMQRLHSHTADRALA